MKRLAISLAGAAILVLGCGTALADSVTYDWTGVVTSSTGAYGSIAAGTVVSGTYTINIGNGNPAFNIGTISTSQPWVVENKGGAHQGLPVQTGGAVFSSTLVGTGVNYASSTNFSLGSRSSAADLVSFGKITGYQATESADSSFTNTSNYVQSGSTLNLTGPSSFSGAGLPLFLFATAASGFIEQDSVKNNVDTSSELFYRINTMTEVAAVPLPATAWLMIGGLVGLGSLARKRRTA
jgi:hypothetical protein